MPNIDKPREIGLFIFTFVLFILIADQLSENHCLRDNLVTTVDDLFFFQL